MLCIEEWSMPAIVEGALVPGDAALREAEDDIAEWSIPCIDEFEAVPAKPEGFIPRIAEWSIPAIAA